MAITARAHRLILRVVDPGSLAAWYGLAFAWPISCDERAEGWIELDAGGFVLALHGGRRGKATTWPKLQLVVADVEEARARLISLGVRMSEVHHWKQLTWSEGSDPEGNVFQVARS